MSTTYRILAINPGATTTRFGLFEDDAERSRRVVTHPDEALTLHPRAVDQLPFRRRALDDFVDDERVLDSRLHAVVGRGGLLRPLASGTYRVDDAMLAELRAADRGDHASNLGALLADDLARRAGAPAYIVDPVCVDELAPVARVSGLAGIERESLSHALSTKAAARRYAREHGRHYAELRLVVAHLGAGISISAHRDGRMVDVTNPRDEGPLSPDRPGSLPSRALVDRCFVSGADPEEVYRVLLGRGGLFSYLGTRDLREARTRALAGDGLAGRVLEAMVYQIGKAIGEMATVLEGRVDAVILTGAMAREAFVVDGVRARVGFVAAVVVYPGEDELLALAEGALRILRGEEEAHRYGLDGEEGSPLV